MRPLSAQSRAPNRAALRFTPALSASSLPSGPRRWPGGGEGGGGGAGGSVFNNGTVGVNSTAFSKTAAGGGFGGKSGPGSTPNTGSAAGIRGVPTVIIYKKGVEVDRKVGGVPESHMKEFLDKNI